ADVVGPRHQHDHLGIDAIELTLGQTPENVLSRVATPAEITGIPAEKVLFPVGEQSLVAGIGSAPTARDGIAFEINTNVTGVRLLQEVLVTEQRVGIGARTGLIA